APGHCRRGKFHERQDLGLSRLDESELQLLDSLLQVNSRLKRQQLLAHLAVVVPQDGQSLLTLLDLLSKLDDLVLLVDVANRASAQQQTNHRGPDRRHKPDSRSIFTVPSH